MLSYSSVIVNVGPGDFNGDGCMDVLITTEAGKPGEQPKNVFVFWGNQEVLSKGDKQIIDDIKKILQPTLHMRSLLDL